MGNKAMIPLNSDPYDSGIDSDEGKAVGNTLHKKDPDDMKKKINIVFNKASLEHALKNSQKADEEQEPLKPIKKKVPKRIKMRDYSDEYDNGNDVKRPLMESFKSQEQQRMANASPDPSDTKWTDIFDSANGRSSPSSLYEVELTASEDDNSVIELIFPTQESLDQQTYWLLEVLCISCMALH